MTQEFKEKLLGIVRNDTEEMIAEWLQFFEDDEQKDDEHRHYDDFLGFFEECVEADLDIKSDATGAMEHFLLKLQEIIGEDAFFNFHNSVYTCFLKFPLFKLLEQKGLFVATNIIQITRFFEAMTSHIMLHFVSKNRLFQESSTKELAEREAPMSEIWEGVLMVSIVGTLDSQRILEIIDKVLNHLEQHGTRHVVVDISEIFDINSEVTSQLMKLNNAIHFMGAKAYITGVTANIAKSLTHLGISFGDIKTYVATKQAIQEIVALSQGKL